MIGMTIEKNMSSILGPYGMIAQLKNATKEEIYFTCTIQLNSKLNFLLVLAELAYVFNQTKLHFVLSQNYKSFLDI